MEKPVRRSSGPDHEIVNATSQGSLTLKKHVRNDYGHQMVGMILTATLVPLLQALTLTHGSPWLFRVGKAVLGVLMLFTIAGFGFRQNEWVHEFELQLGWGILVACVALVVEGFLLCGKGPIGTGSKGAG